MRIALKDKTSAPFAIEIAIDDQLDLLTYRYR